MDMICFQQETKAKKQEKQKWLRKDRPIDYLSNRCHKITPEIQPLQVEFSHE